MSVDRPGRGRVAPGAFARPAHRNGTRPFRGPCGKSGFSVEYIQGGHPMPSTVTAAEVSKNFGAYQDAAVRDPVIITKNGRPRTVLMAYEDFVRLSKRDRRVELTSELSEAEIVTVERSEMVPGLDHLNDELRKHAAD